MKGTRIRAEIEIRVPLFLAAKVAHTWAPTSGTHHKRPSIDGELFVPMGVTGHHREGLPCSEKERNEVFFHALRIVRYPAIRKRRMVKQSQNAPNFRIGVRQCQLGAKPFFLGGPLAFA
jgi:hypothetical protein